MALDIVRRNRNSFLLLLPLWIVIAGFVAFYIPSFQQGASGDGGNETIGSVGGERITAADFQQAYLNRRRFYERMYQGRVDANMLKAMGLESQVFEGLVTEKLVALEAKRLGVTVDDAAVAKAIETDPGLQRDGRFIGKDELKRLLDIQGVSADEFAESKRHELVGEKLQTIVTGALTATAAEALEEFRRRNEQLKAEYVLVVADPQRAGLSATDAEIKARLDAEKERYRIPEKRVVSYLVVDPEALRSQVSVTDGDMDQYYQAHRSEFTEPEEVCASHILVRAKSATETEGHSDADAKQIATDLLAKARATTDFAALAKKSSEDKGSQANGGDLGCFARGRMVPEFEAAAFGLDAGKISDLVKSPYGYHIIRVASRKAETTPVFSAVKEKIRTVLTGERAATLADEKQGAIADSLSKGRSLEQVAQEQKGSLQKSAPFARGETPAGPIGSKALVAKAFALKPGETEKTGFRVGAGAVAFIALADVQPGRAAELKDVGEKVKADILEEKAFAQARERAQALKAKAEGGSLEKASSSMGLVRKETLSLVSRTQPLGDLGSGASLEAAVFALPEKVLSDPLRTASGYAIVRVTEKKPYDPASFEKEKGSILAQLTQAKRSNLFESFIRQARERYAVEQRGDIVRRISG